MPKFGQMWHFLGVLTASSSLPHRLLATPSPFNFLTAPPDSDDDAKDLDEFKDLDDDDIDDISKMGVPLSKEQKLNRVIRY